eukprot:TRINITY_DN10343_c0_g2_i1.p1 TRINITY_DN10343_c0_g2~~TRINITY_DN10343_c0_g2_i1.p1  ORF type:complete len:189 (+),score=48.59 TRINITY_DN10343_c0_g2_i1:52-618(+)
MAPKDGPKMKTENNGPYHSQYNGTKAKELCGCGIYPLRTKMQGPAEITDGDDILDEVLYNFKANMLFQQYSVKGAGDRTLLYLTLYVHHVLRLLKEKTVDDSKKVFLEIKNKNFEHPGDRGFPLIGFLPAPTTADEGEEWRAYMRQCREELNNRIVERIYQHPTVEGFPDKFWTMFCKRKFLGKVLEK